MLPNKISAAAAAAAADVGWGIIKNKIKQVFRDVLCLIFGAAFGDPKMLFLTFSQGKCST